MDYKKLIEVSKPEKIDAKSLLTKPIKPALITLAVLLVIYTYFYLYGDLPNIHLLKF